jgi:hypothetical protein
MKHLFFKLGLVVQIVLIIAHLSYNIHGLPIPDTDEKSHQLLELMSTYEIQFSEGPKRTMDQTIRGYDFTWASFILFTVLMSVFALRSSAFSTRIGKYVTISNIFLWGLCLIVALMYWSPPQQIFFGILLLLFTLSYFFDWKDAKAKDLKVCVVGAGVSGLTAAYELNKQGYHNITVLEKADYIGGKCQTLIDDEKPFDLGGHEMLGGYTDIVNIGKELNAPTRRSIPPVVYDKDQRKYLNFVQSANASGEYSLFRVGIATMKYLWLVGVKFRKYSNPANGYRNIPDELAMDLESWLSYRKLDAIKNILVFVIKVQGYGQFKGTPAAYLVKFMGFRNWASLLLDGLGIYKKWPRVFTFGMQNFCERMAATIIDVRTGIDISRIERKEGARDGISVFLSGKDKPLQFDRLILATSLEKSSIEFMDFTKEESALFDHFESYRFYTTYAKVEGLDAGVVASNPMNDIKAGEYNGYIKDFTDEPYAIFFSLALNDSINGEVIKEKIEKVLKGIVPFKGVQPKVEKFLYQKEWHYFPHIPSGKGNIIDIYNAIEKMQGVKNTFFVSSTLSFECVGNSVAYSCRVMRDEFK